jgi:hypothetical protein
MYPLAGLCAFALHYHWRNDVSHCWLEKFAVLNDLESRDGLYDSGLPKTGFSVT